MPSKLAARLLQIEDKFEKQQLLEGDGSFKKSTGAAAVSSTSPIAADAKGAAAPNPASRSSPTSRSSLDEEQPPLVKWGVEHSYGVAVMRDMQHSPRWQQYMQDLQVYKMMQATDRTLPMSMAARSPRHLREHGSRLVPPAQPKPKALTKVRKENASRTLAEINEPWTPMKLVRDVGHAIMSLVNGFLEQDFEVQILIIVMMISAFFSVRNGTHGFLVHYKYESLYADGQAPPMPPAPPVAPNWKVSASDAAVSFALKHPVIYLLIDYGIALIIGALVYFMDDIKAFNERQRLRRRAREQRKAGYVPVGDRLRTAGRMVKVIRSIITFAFSDLAKTVKSPRTKVKQLVDPEDPPQQLDTEDDLRMARTREHDLIEELEIKAKVHAAAGSPLSAALQNRLKLHKERQALIKEALKGMLGEQAEKSSSTPVVAKPPLAGGGGFLHDLAKSPIVTVLKNSLNGFVSVFFFFADVVSDIAVIVLLYETENYEWALMAAAALAAQFFVMYMRCLPYLRSTFGADSCLTRTFTYIGLPIGLLLLDILMLLEPFGLLTVLPLPIWLKQFIPAYKATRVIVEIAVESLPQSLLQSYILIVVVWQTQAGTASPEVLAMVSNVKTMSLSITLSTLAILKTWIEVVQQSREAGISVPTKARQLWDVGAGLPLDALKKGSIVDWACTYVLNKAEIPPLIDALGKNTSLSRLNLAKVGFEWDRAGGSASPIVEALNKEPTALAGLHKLVINDVNEFEIPMGEIRGGQKRALAALEGLTFFALGHNQGPWHVDIMVMGDVLRKNLDWRIATDRETQMGDEVMRLLEDAHAGHLSRKDWEERTKFLMASGDLRRSLLQSLVGAEILRQIGFKSKDLISAGVSLWELKSGRFTVAELRESGVSVGDLSSTRYSAAELREGGVVAAELLPLKYEPRIMRDGGYSAAEMRAAKYQLADLKGVYTAKELYEAEYPAAEMRRVGFETAELRAAQWPAEMLRKGGYSATEIREGGFNASQTREAGYTATEATAAGWALAEMKGANYDAAELRKAMHTAEAMREAGFTAAAMKAAKYPPKELYEAGYSVEEIRKAGTGVPELMAAGATIAEIRLSGVSAATLKIEGVKLKDMRLGGYTCKDVKAAGYKCKEVKAAGFVKGLKEAGYTVNEAVAAQYSCEELYKGGYAAEELLAVGFKPLEMRAVGYDARALQAAGVTLPNLRSAGVQVRDLRSAGYGYDELRLVGVKAAELKEAAATAAEMKEAGYPLEDFYKFFRVSELRDCGFSCEELRIVGFRAKELLSTGATNRELRDGGYSAGELREIGLTAKELKALQFTCAELKLCGFNAKQLANVNFGAHQLKMAGFRPRQVKESGFKGASVFGLAELKADGFKVPELRDDEGFTLDQLRVCFSVEELRLGNVTAKELLKCGYSLEAMRKGGFDASQLQQAGYGVLDMKKAGFTCVEVRQAGFVEGIMEAGYTCKEARAAGYVDDIKRAGYSVSDLKAVGYTFAEVRAAGYVQGIKAAGYTAKEAKMDRFPPKLLRAAGFTCSEAKQGGYVKELKAAGYTPQEAREAGCTIDDVRECGYIEGLCGAGYTVRECFEANFACKHARLAGFVEGFKSAGYTLTEAKVAGFTPEGFRRAGYSCEDFKVAGFTCKQAKESGYSAKDAKAAGWSFGELSEAGYVMQFTQIPPNGQLTPAEV